MLFSTLFTHAQEKLWGIQDGSVFQMNPDGSDKIQIYKEESLGNYSGSGLRKGTDGFLYGLTSDTHTFYRYDEDADTVISIFDSTEETKLDYLVDADGVVFFLTPTGLFSVRSDGTDFRLLNSFENSGITPLTITDGDDGWIYGTANKGQYSGAIWKIRKADGWFEKLHDLEFTFEAESRPTDRCFINSQGFLVGLLKGVARYSNNAFYRLKKDGTEFSYSESKLRNINSGIILHTSDNLIIFYGNVGYPEGRNAFFSADENGNNIRSLYTYPLETPAELTNIIELPNGKICGIGWRWGIGTRFITLEKDGTDYNEIGIGASGPIVIGSNQKIYGAAGNAVYNVNVDGSDLNVLYEFGQSKLGGSTSLIVKGQNAVYGLNLSGNINGLLFKIADSGVSKVYDLSIDESNGQISGLTEGNDGFIYGVGTTEWGYDDHIFRVLPDGSGFQSVQLHIPGFINGKLLKLSTGEIYGVSEGGGSPRKGIIFKVRSDFTGVDIMYNFSDANGKVPLGALMEGADGFLYGTTRTGGSTLYGVIFKVLPNGQQYIKLHEFDNINGRFPNGGLVQDHNGYLYGVTPEGGQYKKGVLYRIKPDGTDYTVLYHFDGTTASNPFGQLIIDNDDFLYGTADPGIVYRVKNDGTEFSKVLEGGNPRLYFSTPPFESTVQVVNPSDGSSGLPINPVLKVTKVDNAFNYKLQISESNSFDSVLINLENSTNIFPLTNLKYGTTYFARAKSSISPGYGPTTSFTTQFAPATYPPKLWGIQDNAVVYMNLDGSQYEKSFQDDFNNPGPFPLGEFPNSITLINNEIFGANKLSNQAQDGITLYKMNGAGIQGITVEDNNFNTIKIIEGPNGFVYGIGTCVPDICTLPFIFKLTTDISGYTKQNINIYGFTPTGGLITTTDHKMIGLSGGGGANNRGFMYAIRPDLSGIDILYSFSGPDGKAATTKLLEGHDGKLYGITTTGGLYNYGAVFSIQSNGQNYTKLHDFTSSRKDGTNPVGNLVQDSNGVLYGIGQLSGLHKKGMIFKINPDGTDYSVVYSFDGVLAENPSGNLLIESDYLYGSASGKFFRVKTNGTDFTILHEGVNATNNLSFITTEPIEQDTYIIDSPEVGSPGFSFFSVPIASKPYAVQYTLEVSKYADFHELAFMGSTGHHFYDASFVEIPVTNLEYSTQYYARARSSQLPYFGPIHSFTTLPQTKRLFGLSRTGGPTACGHGSLAGGAIFSIELDGSNFIKHRDHKCHEGMLGGSLVQGYDGALYGMNNGIDYPDGSGFFRMDLSGNFRYISTQDFWSSDFMSASNGSLYSVQDSYPDANKVLRRTEPHPSMIANPSVLFTLNNSQGILNVAPVEGIDGYLYGLTTDGGISQDGIMYKIDLEGEDFQVLHNFDQATGANPHGRMIKDANGYFYGYTSFGGANDQGNIFRFDPDGTNYTAIYNFDDPESFPINSLLISGDTLYGLALNETNYIYTIFKVHISGAGYTTIYEFDSDVLQNGSISQLVTDGLSFYGIFSGDGYHDLGKIFRIKKDGSDYSIIHEFTNYTGGWIFDELLLVDPDDLHQNAKAQPTARKPNVEISSTEREKLVNISPNPFKSTFKVEVLSSTAPAIVTIVDVSGRVLSEQVLATDKTNELGEELASGFYVVRIVQGSDETVHRMIKK